LTKYGHFRRVQLEEKREFIDRGDALLNYNFLDSIDFDCPKGCWAIHLDASKTEVEQNSLTL